jgi:hypothetical protein
MTNPSWWILALAQELTGIGWDVQIEIVGASWLSEVSIAFTDTDNDTELFFLRPGFSDDNPGTETYSSEDFVDLFDGLLVSTFVHAWQRRYWPSFLKVFDDIPKGVGDAQFNQYVNGSKLIFEFGTVRACCIASSRSVGTENDCAALGGSFIGADTDSSEDENGDGVADTCDFCLGTSKNDPSRELKPNHWAFDGTSGRRVDGYMYMYTFPNFLSPGM